MPEATTLIDPLPVFFTFARIRPQFSCGRYVHDTLQAILDGALSIEQLPPIGVLTDGQHLYSLNNRRLYVFKELRRRGFLDTVPARVRPVPQTKRMATKYTPVKCALEAKLMGGQSKQGTDPADVDEGVADDVKREEQPAIADVVSVVNSIGEKASNPEEEGEEEENEEEEEEEEEAPPPRRSNPFSTLARKRR